MKQEQLHDCHCILLYYNLAPEGTAMVLEYLNLSEAFWDWERIFEPIYSFMDQPEDHKLKHLEPRVDFFRKHPTQIQQGNITTD